MQQGIFHHIAHQGCGRSATPARGDEETPSIPKFQKVLNLTRMFHVGVEPKIVGKPPKWMVY